MILELLCVRIGRRDEPPSNYQRQAINILSINVLTPHSPDVTIMRLNCGSVYYVKAEFANLLERMREAHADRH